MKIKYFNYCFSLYIFFIFLSLIIFFFSTEKLEAKVFNINTTNGYTGITTAPEVRRINPLAITYSDFDKTT